MADETPTLRLGPQGSDQDAEHWAHLMLDDQYAGTVLDATAECIAALAAALRQPRCGDTTEFILGQPPLVCDLAYGHPGTSHSCAQPGISSRAEWTYNADRTEIESLRSRLTEVERQRDAEAKAHQEADEWLSQSMRRCYALQDENRRMLPVVEAAQRWLEALKAKGWYGRGEEQPYSPLRTELAAAVDLYNQGTHRG